MHKPEPREATGFHAKRADAIGNTSGDLYAVDYPINMPGNSNGRCLTWGWLVGKTVAAL